MKKLIFLSVLMLGLTGCGLIPKRVEFFQSKVGRFPEPTESQKELQKEAAQRAKEKAQEVLMAAKSENASDHVVAPAAETVELTDAVSQSVGSPLKRPTETSQALSDQVRKSVAKLDQKIDSFKQKNDKNAGKKIEDTGVFNFSYFGWTGGVVAFILLVWVVLRAILSAASAVNPGAAVAVGGMNVATSVLAKGFHQIVEGGEDFKKWIGNEISDPSLKQRILGAFQANHVTAQDSDVQAVVKQLTK